LISLHPGFDKFPTPLMLSLQQCSTKNVIYGIDCTLCGLLYVGETRQTLRSRMNQHRHDARDPKIFRGTHISFATMFRVVAKEDLVYPGDVLAGMLSLISLFINA
jgi:hypothetical protein